MRSFAVLATMFAATIGTASAQVRANTRTRVDVDANGYDKRMSASGGGCSPNGCVPENTLDYSTATNSIWSCQGDILDSSDEDDGCCITYSFEEPQDIIRMLIAFLYPEGENSRTLDVFENGRYHSQIRSSGRSLSYQVFDNLDTDETEDIKLCMAFPIDNHAVWLGIAEVIFVVD